MLCEDILSHLPASERLCEARGQKASQVVQGDLSTAIHELDPAQVCLRHRLVDLLVEADALVHVRRRLLRGEHLLHLEALVRRGDVLLQPHLVAAHHLQKDHLKQLLQQLLGAKS